MNFALILLYRGSPILSLNIFLGASSCRFAIQFNANYVRNSFLLRLIKY